MIHRVFHLGLFAIALAAGAASTTGCAVDSDEAASGEQAIVIESQRLQELVTQVEVAEKKSEDLKKASMAFVGVRGANDLLPIFSSTQEIALALEPVLLKLEERLTAVPSEDLKRLGYTDVPDTEYNAVIDVVRGLRTTLSTELTAAAAQLVNAQSPKTAEEETRLRGQINAYSDIVFSVSLRLSNVSAQLKTWLSKATPATETSERVVERELDVHISGACGSSSDAESSWNATCLQMKENLLQAFPDAVDDFTCGASSDVGTTNYCFQSKGSVTYRIPVKVSEEEIEVVPQALRGSSGSAHDANESWKAACADLLANAQSFTVPARKVVGASCGAPKDVGTTSYRFESVATLLIMRR